MLARAGLLTIPEETAPPQLLVYQHQAWEEEASGEPAANLEAVLRDPTFYALHAGILRATAGEVPLADDRYQEALDHWRAGTVDTAPAGLRRAILSDPAALESMHALARSQLLPPQSPLLG